MAADDALKRIEERLARLETQLAQGAPGGAVVDPPAWPWGGWPRPPHRPWPGPIVDKAAYARVPQVSAVVDPAVYRPSYIADPAPWPISYADPQPSPWALPAALPWVGHVGGDPPPSDFSRFSVAQLEASLHTIAAEKSRLTAMEGMIKQLLEKQKQQAG